MALQAKLQSWHEAVELDMIIPPIPTPFENDGTLMLDKLVRHIDALAPFCDALLVLGSTGEAIALSEQEREQMIHEARQLASTKPLLVGTGGENTQLVISRNQRAAELGADRVLILPPHYYKGLMQDDVLSAHYERIADESPLPVMLYNIPQVTGIALSPALVARLATHENIVGMKDSSGNLGAFAEFIRRTPETFEVFTGHAPTLLAALSLGARGGILAAANVLAENYKALIQSFKQGDLDKARGIQFATNPFAVALGRYGIPALKAALSMRGLDVGVTRAPLPRLSQQGQEVIEDALAQL